MTSLYLASGSPRRQELLAQLGVTFERIVTGIEEQRQPQESAQQYVVRLAREKAQAGVAQTAQYSGAGWLFCQEDKWQLSRRSRLTAG